jgi:hypothetical protein
MTTSVDASTASRRPGWEGDASDAPGEPPTRDERADRAAATQRYEAFLEGSPCHYACQPEDQVVRPVLFRQQDHDAHKISEHDVKQNRLDDCFLMATLAGLARTPEGRAAIENAITENKNEKGEVTSYTVTLQKPEKSYGGLGAKTFTPVPVTVYGQFVCGHAKARTDDGGSEVWPLVIERAFQEYKDRDYGMCNGDDKVGGPPMTAMELLTGKEARQIPLWSVSGYRNYSAGQLQRDIDSGKIVVLDTKKTFEGANPYGLTDFHAYVVTGTENYGGRLYVNLHNPYDTCDVRVPYDDLENWFSAVDVGSVR